MKTKIVPVHEVTAPQRNRMFQIMNLYYDNVTFEQFNADLDEKNHVILLLGQRNEIFGFSTILQKVMHIRGQRTIALYSGDTVLDREYWGNGALASAFGRYLTQVKLKNFFTPTYWYLISKGYKTYLLMTNNFPTHYPQYNKQTPNDIREMMDHFYSGRFKNLYDCQSGLIKPRGLTCALKISVSDIDNTLLKNPKIKFFADRNPKWQSGEELACIAEVTLWIPIRYALKRIQKTVLKILTPPKKEKYATHKH